MLTNSIGTSSATPSIPIATERLLESRRASFVFALLVFAITAVQVLAVPVAALVGGEGEWPLYISPAISMVLLTVGCAVQAGALLLSNRWPRLALVVASGTYLAFALGLAVPSWLIGMYLVIALAQFLLATRSSALTSVLWAVGVSTISMSALFAWVLSIGTPMNFAIGFVTAEGVRFGAPVVGGTALGIWWRAQMKRVAIARAEADRVKQAHAQRLSEERARIAQELHDVAGQHLAGLMTLADAALTIVSARPNDAIELMEEVRNEGRFAAASLTGALSDLRVQGVGQADTTPDLRQLSVLVDYWRQRAMPVRVDVSGDLSDLPAVVSTTSYRCVQEALTNAAKHAPGAAVAVGIRFVPTLLSVSVRNGTPTAGSPPAAAVGLGWGLQGMRERVSILHGKLSTTTTESGGWLLSFEIPIAASPE